MSELRRERKKEKEEEAAPINWRRILYVVLIVAAFGTVYYLGYQRRQHRYDAFAKCLKDRGVKMYGAWWCPHCQEQKERFGASFKMVNYVECGVEGDTSARTQVCKDEGIQHYPTWQFPPTGERVERVFTMEELSDRTACPLP
jgi:hypothetical protein